MTADSTPDVDLDRLRAVAEAATPGPWTRGDRWHVGGVMPRFGKGKCSWCERGGEPPSWVGHRDINGTVMLAHVHTEPEPWYPTSVYAEREDGPVVVIVETDEYGEMSEEDAAHVTTFDPPTVLALLGRIEQAEAEVFDWIARCHLASEARDSARAQRDAAEAKVAAVERLARRGVGTDLTPTTDGKRDVGWWYSYLRRHDQTWRAQLEATLDGRAQE